MELKYAEDYFKVSRQQTRSECEGPVNFVLINPSHDSWFKRTYNLDLNTQDYVGSELIHDFEDADDSNLKFFKRMNIEFHDYKLKEKFFQFPEYGDDWY